MKRGLLKGSKFLCSDEVNKQIWGLFAQMQENPNIEVEHVMEIVDRAMEGAIDLTKKFNLYGYDYAVKTNRKRKQRKKAAIETFIDFSGNKDEDTPETRGGVSIDVVSYQADMLSEAKNEFEQLFDNAELKCAIESIKSLNDDFIVDYSVDLIALIKKAVHGIPQAVLKLKEVCEQMSCVAEQVKIILNSGVSIDECFA